MFSYVAHQKDKSWQPGPYPGVELMLLHKNEQTGGVMPYMVPAMGGVHVQVRNDDLVKAREILGVS